MDDIKTLTSTHRRPKKHTLFLSPNSVQMLRDAAHAKGARFTHLLEEASDWKAAVAVYRKLGAAGGTRSDEAKARLTQLRLEHFLWDE